MQKIFDKKITNKSKTENQSAQLDCFKTNSPLREHTLSM